MIKKVYHHFMKDSLYRNSIYLMLSTGIMAFFGFFFWIINARLFRPEQVGIATTLISVMTLLTNLSLLGFDNSLIRYLPKSTKRSEMISSALMLVVFSSIVSSIVFIGGLQIFSPKLLFLQSNIFYIFTFTAFVMISTFNVLTDSIFMGYRSSGNILIKNSVLSILKISFPLIFISLSSYGIFLSVASATFLAVLFGFTTLFLKYKLKPVFTFNKNVIKDMAFYSGGNYIASFFSQAPTLILPLLIINNLGAKTAAYFYIDMMVFSFLTIISGATTQSLLAEGSNNETKIGQYFLKSLKIVLIFLLPAIIIIVCFGNLILHAFGKSYAAEAFSYLQLVSISAIFMSISILGNSILRLKHKIKQLIAVNGLGDILVLSLSYLFIHNGLIGVGVGWLLGRIILACIYIIFLGKEVFINKAIFTAILNPAFIKLRIRR